MEEDELESQEVSFTINPRQIFYDYNNGLITTAERTLLLWMRLQGTPYGFAHFNMKALAEDTFTKTVDPSYINRLLGSLRSKGYIYYKDRKGCRGSFQVHFDYWIVSKGIVLRLDGGMRKIVSTKTANVSEDNPIEESKLMEEIRSTYADIVEE
jgi:hypothetical protein